MGLRDKLLWEEAPLSDDDDDREEGQIEEIHEFDFEAEPVTTSHYDYGISETPKEPRRTSKATHPHTASSTDL